MSDSSWADATIIGFDTETTGLSPERDRIATATVIFRSASGDEVHNWIINPGVPMPPAASAVNGLTDAYLQANGGQPQIVLGQIAQVLAQAMSQGLPLVGYNLSYDLQMLEADLRRHGLRTLQSRLGGGLEPLMDPLVLDRVLDRYRKGKRNLAVSCAAYGLNSRTDYHSAEGDVKATLDLLEAMVRRFPQLRQMSLPELQRFQCEGHRQWAEQFNQFMQDKHARFRPVASAWPLPDHTE